MSLLANEIGYYAHIHKFLVIFLNTRIGEIPLDFLIHLPIKTLRIFFSSTNHVLKIVKIQGLSKIESVILKID